MIDAHRPADETGLRASIQPRNLANGFGSDSGQPARMFRCVLRNVQFQRIETGRVLLYKLRVGQAFGDEHVNHGVEQCNVRSWLQRKMNVGHHRRLRNARIGHYNHLRRTLTEALAEDGVIVGDIRADQ